MRDEVCIVGMGYTKFGGLWNKKVGDLVTDAAFESFEHVEVRRT